MTSKRLFAALLAAIAAISLVACAGGNVGNPSSFAVANEATIPAVTTDSGGEADGGWSDALPFYDEEILDRADFSLRCLGLRKTDSGWELGIRVDNRGSADVSASSVYTAINGYVMPLSVSLYADAGVSRDAVVSISDDDMVLRRADGGKFEIAPKGEIFEIHLQIAAYKMEGDDNLISDGSEATVLRLPGEHNYPIYPVPVTNVLGQSGGMRVSRIDTMKPGALYSVLYENLTDGDMSFGQYSRLVNGCDVTGLRFATVIHSGHRYISDVAVKASDDFPEVYSLDCSYAVYPPEITSFVPDETEPLFVTDPVHLEFDQPITER